jgi:hypothetical protein
MLICMVAEVCVVGRRCSSVGCPIEWVCCAKGVSLWKLSGSSQPSQPRCSASTPTMCYCSRIASTRTHLLHNTPILWDSPHYYNASPLHRPQQPCKSTSTPPTAAPLLTCSQHPTQIQPPSPHHRTHPTYTHSPAQYRTNHQPHQHTHQLYMQHSANFAHEAPNPLQSKSNTTQTKHHPSRLRPLATRRHTSYNPTRRPQTPRRVPPLHTQRSHARSHSLTRTRRKPSNHTSKHTHTHYHKHKHHHNDSRSPTHTTTPHTPFHKTGAHDTRKSHSSQAHRHGHQGPHTAHLHNPIHTQPPPHHTPHNRPRVWHSS